MKILGAIWTAAGVAVLLAWGLSLSYRPKPATPPETAVKKAEQPVSFVYTPLPAAVVESDVATAAKKVADEVDGIGDSFRGILRENLEMHRQQNENVRVLVDRIQDLQYRVQGLEHRVKGMGQRIESDAEMAKLGLLPGAEIKWCEGVDGSGVGGCLRADVASGCMRISQCVERQER